MRAKRHINLEWDRFQVSIGETPEVLKFTLVMLTSNTILDLLSMITWGVRSIPLNM
jgi:hypothetical protein